MARKSVTLKDIARKAEVSIATASLVLNNKASRGNVRIGEDTIARVQRVAEELDYFPNLSARAMSGGRTSIVGLILHEIKFSATQLPLIYGINDVLGKAGFSLAVEGVTQGNADVEMEQIRIANRKGFDGLVLEASGMFLSRAGELHEAFRDWRRVVIVNRRPAGGFVTVTVDHDLGGYLATRHLIDLGHRRVAFAGRYPDIPDTDDPLMPGNAVARYRGYVRAVEEAELEPIVVRLGQDVLDLPRKATGIYCSLSYDATDLLATCHDRGVRVPQDLSIVGQDDAREKQIVRPDMTTVDVRSRELGEQAARAVMGLIEGAAVDNVVLTPLLRVRRSTAPPGEGVGESTTETPEPAREPSGVTA